MFTTSFVVGIGFICFAAGLGVGVICSALCLDGGS